MQRSQPRAQRQPPPWASSRGAERVVGDRRRLCLVGVADVKRPRAASGCVRELIRLLHSALPDHGAPERVDHPAITTVVRLACSGASRYLFDPEPRPFSEVHPHRITPAQRRTTAVRLHRRALAQCLLWGRPPRSALDRGGRVWSVAFATAARVHRVAGGWPVPASPPTAGSRSVRPRRAGPRAENLLRVSSRSGTSACQARTRGVNHPAITAVFVRRPARPAGGRSLAGWASRTPTRLRTRAP